MRSPATSSLGARVSGEGESEAERRGVMVMAAAEVTAPNTQTFLSSLTLFDVKPRHFLEHLCDPASES